MDLHDAPLSTTVILSMVLATGGCAGAKRPGRRPASERASGAATTAATVTTTGATAFLRDARPGTVRGDALFAPPRVEPRWKAPKAARVMAAWSGRRVVAATTTGALHAPASDTTAAWSRELGTRIVGLDSDRRGQLRVTTARGEVIALRDDGTTLWTAQLGASTAAGAIIAPDGTTYALADGLHALDAGGALRWYVPRVGGTRAGPAIVGELIAFGTQHGDLVAVDASGAPRWTLHVGATIASAPCEGPDGDILVGDDLGILRRVGLDGVERWSLELSRRVVTTPSVGSAGHIAVVTADGTLHSIDRTGTLQWTVRPGGGAAARPAIDETGAVLLPAIDNHLYLIAPDGQIRWRASVQRPISTPPLGTPDGGLYFGTGSAELIQLQQGKTP